MEVADCFPDFVSFGIQLLYFINYKAKKKNQSFLGNGLKNSKQNLPSADIVLKRDNNFW